MKKETLKVLEDIFGAGRVPHYQQQIDDAMKSEGAFKDDHGLIHGGIILALNAGYGSDAEGEDFFDSFRSKAGIYKILEAFVAGKDSIDMSGVLIPSDPIDVLTAAKKYIDEFSSKVIQEDSNKK